MALSPGAGQPLSAEQREKLVKQKEQYEKAAEKLEDQVKYLKFRFKTKMQDCLEFLIDTEMSDNISVDLFFLCSC